MRYKDSEEQLDDDKQQSKLEKAVKEPENTQLPPAGRHGGWTLLENICPCTLNREQLVSTSFNSITRAPCARTKIFSMK